MAGFQPSQVEGSPKRRHLAPSPLCKEPILGEGLAWPPAADGGSCASLSPSVKRVMTWALHGQCRGNALLRRRPHPPLVHSGPPFRVTLGATEVGVRDCLSSLPACAAGRPAAVVSFTPENRMLRGKRRRGRRCSGPWGPSDPGAIWGLQGMGGGCASLSACSPPPRSQPSSDFLPWLASVFLGSRCVLAI